MEVSLEIARRMADAVDLAREKAVVPSRRQASEHKNHNTM
jgi:hypothetical protein